MENETAKYIRIVSEAIRYVEDENERFINGTACKDTIAFCPFDAFEVAMSSSKIRLALNRICKLTPDCRYLEVGVHSGSTLLSASYMNDGKFTGVDNFCKFNRNNKAKNALFKSMEDMKEECRVDFVEMDFWELLPKLPDNGFNVYFYDGMHDEESQRRAFSEVHPKLADPCIAMVDDWNKGHIRKGTMDGIEEAGLSVAIRHDFFTEQYTDGSFEYNDKIKCNPHTWWNGFVIMVLERK